MPEISLWGLVTALAVLAFGLTLKIADMRRTVKNLQKEINTARSEIKTLNDKFNKDISDIKELNQRRINELTETISNLEKQLAIHRTKPIRYETDGIV